MEVVRDTVHAAHMGAEDMTLRCDRDAKCHKGQGFFLKLRNCRERMTAIMGGVSVCISAAWHMEVIVSP